MDPRTAEIRFAASTRRSIGDPGAKWIQSWVDARVVRLADPQGPPAVDELCVAVKAHVEANYNEDVILGPDEFNENEVYLAASETWLCSPDV